MTIREHLALPISERIKRYENECEYGNPEGVSHRAHCEIYAVVPKSEIQEYVLYRLKREEFEQKELEKEAAASEACECAQREFQLQLAHGGEPLPCPKCGTVWRVALIQASQPE